jgi:DNA-binding MarR family transcriptional regulator
MVLTMDVRSLLDKSNFYVYTYFMTELSPQSNLTKVSLVPAICMGMHIRRASRIMTQIYDAALRPVGLVLNQFTLLVAIHLVESTPVTRLAQELFTDQTTLTRNLKVLEKRGLVVIEPGEDRRVRLVSLTPEGRALLAQALPLWEQAQAEVQARFGQQRWQTLLSLLSDTQALVDTP